MRAITPYPLRAPVFTQKKKGGNDMKNRGKEWLIAALIRAIRTMAQTALSMVAVGMAISDVDWLKLLSVSVVAGFVSILTSIATGLPEATTNGELLINTEADDSSALAGLALDHNVTPEYIEELAKKGSINIRVRKTS